MAEVEQNLVIGGPETWQRWDNAVAIFTTRTPLQKRAFLLMKG